MYIDPMNPVAVLLVIILKVLQIYSWIIIAAVVMSWLFAFNVVNYHNNIVRGIARFLDALTEPVFRLVRRYVPPMGGLDFAPIIVLVSIWILQGFVVPWIGIFLLRLFS